MIRLLKSSAGSGKTFNLAKTYISMLLGSNAEDSYRHILAVTFTNKATAEMKGRILKELSILADDPSKSDYKDDFRKEFGSDGIIKEKSRKLLVNILHDYGSFSVSTIDKFFQRTLKAFAREVGQYASYQVELDKDSLINESVDRILSSINDEDAESGKLLGWLSESVMDSIETYGKFNLEKNLYTSAKRLLSEEHREVVEENGIDEDIVYSKKNISSLRTSFREIITEFPKRCVKAAKAVAKAFDEAGVDMQADTYQSFMYKGISNLLTAESSKEFNVPTAAFMKRASNVEDWFTKPKKNLVPQVAGVVPHVEDMLDLFRKEPLKEYNTAKALYSSLHGLGILAEIRQQFHDLMKEKNVLSIDDSNILLRKIIGEDDAPFIYEKLGVTLEHFLLDEFQDTSKLQWQNFLPLLKESEANSEGERPDNLIVGDVKQSIYRFRGSDWKLLDENVKKEFPTADDGNPLTENWRSLKEVVTFNNRFFSYAAGVLDAKYGSGDTVRRIYSDVVQEIRCKDKADGSVRVTFCDKKDDEQEVVLASIKNARDRGAKWGDIAVLVRWNRDGSAMAARLVSEGVPVVSDDSLLVSSSIVVRRLVSLLSLINDPGGKVSTYMVKELEVELPQSWYSLVDLAEELLRQLKDKEPDSFEGAVPYIMAFMDDLQEWTSVNGNNLGEYLRHWGDSDLKISSPADSDAVRIITVHKAKGLEFPYVIVPMADGVSLFKDGVRWAVPSVESTSLEGMNKAAFPVNLSAKSEDTLFAEDYRDDLLLQYVDNINVFYVALTRAGKELHVISTKPSSSCAKGVVPFDPDIDKLGGRYEGPFPTDAANFGQILFLFLKGGYDSFHPEKNLIDEYLASEIPDAAPDAEIEGPSAIETEEFYIGKPYDYSKMERDKKDYESVCAGYPSFPISGAKSEAVKDEEDVKDEETIGLNVASSGRLRFRSDAADFFRIGSEPGIGSSPRLRGIVLHDILSRVQVPSDLSSAVEAALIAGDLDSSDAKGYYEMLSDLIKEVSPRGWFPTDPSSVSNESSIISLKGSIYRPDRVIKNGKSLIVVDYKFVEDIDASRENSEKHYIRQVSGYMSLYRQMGWLDVKGAIWYISLSERGSSYVTDIL